ncbi:PAS domain-containing protein [Telluria aromaticivorans]|uniref:PAS domain-containing protein n=1 Tax=Telluria aromaticivorans TaxID=2725995 RepID=UPI001E3B55F1|nr:PAS domain-containing protein [Telluria aromaticivorans]
MVTGSGKDDHAGKPLDIQGGGQSAGVPASGEVEGNAVSTLGNPGVKHWQAGYIGRAGLGDRANVFFAAVEMTRMPMVVTDPNQPDNPIVFTNGAFLDLTGYEEKDVLGRNCRFLQGPDTDCATIAEVRHAVAEQRAVAVDVLNYKADGEPFWNALFIGPIFDHEGKLLYFFASQMDISERRGMQEANLQAQKMEAIGQSSAGMAHDFNNLLQVINGNLELALLTSGASPKAAEPIRRAQRATMQAGKLTQQLLSFARKQRLEQKDINLNSLVVDFSDMLVRTLGDKVELRLDLKPGLPPCTLDTTYLEMALLNVVINARDAMPDGGVVTVGTALTSQQRRSAAAPASCRRAITCRSA